MMSDGERTLVGLDAAVERVVARVDAADTTPPLEEGLAGRRAYAPDVVRKRVRLRSAAPVEPYVEGWERSHRAVSERQRTGQGGRNG